MGQTTAQQTFVIDNLSATEGQVFNGVGYSDTYIIKAGLTKNIKIDDSATGTDDNGDVVKNKIIFDPGVTITMVESFNLPGATRPFVFYVTLDTGARIEIYAPSYYSFTIDGTEYTDHLNFFRDYHGDAGDAVFSITSDGDTAAPTVGDELTATVSVADPDGTGTGGHWYQYFTDSDAYYQWFHVGGADIEGATSQSYTLTASDAGKTIGVRVTYLDGDGRLEFVEAEPTGVVLVGDNHATSLALAEGATTRVYENADVSAGIKIGDIEITDADGGSYGTLELAGDDKDLFELRGTELWLKEGASLDHETAERLDVRVQLAENDAVGVDVPISVANVNEGGARFAITSDGDVLTATQIHADPEGLGWGQYGDYSYNWVHLDKTDDSEYYEQTPLGVNTPTYTLSELDAGKLIAVMVIYYDGRGAVEVVGAAWWGEVAPDEVPNIANSSLITITGTDEAYEDNSMRDPEGQVVLADGRMGYALSVGTTAVTADGTTIALQYGTLTIDQDGRWSYALDNTNAAVDALDGDDDDSDGASGTLTEQVTFTYTGAGGVTLSRTLEITINGATDYATADSTAQVGWLTVDHSDQTEDVTLRLPESSIEGLERVKVRYKGGAGDDVIHGTDAFLEVFRGGEGDDWLFGYDGSDVFDVEADDGNDVIDGGIGNGAFADKLYFNGKAVFGADALVRVEHAIQYDMNDETKWKFDSSTQSWVSADPTATDYADYTFTRIWVDDNDDGVADAGDTYKYVTNIERLHFHGSNEDDIITGGDGYNHISGRGGHDVLTGGASRDVLRGDRGNDTLDGAAGWNTLRGGEGNDIFVLYQGIHARGEENLSEVVDFSSGTVSGKSSYNGTTRGGNDRIRVETDTGSETTLAALKAVANIRWTQDSNYDGHDTWSNNDSSLNDTNIYDTKGTEDTSDDTVIMVLQDFSAPLTMDHFQVVKREGSEDSGTPAGHVATALALNSDAITSIAEDADVTSGIKMGIIEVTDPGGGTYGTLELTGADAGLFEIREVGLRGAELWLKPGVSLDHETADSLNVRVQLAENNAIGVDIPVTVTNVDEGVAGLIIFIETDATLGTLVPKTDNPVVGDVLAGVINAKLDQSAAFGVTNDPDPDGLASGYNWQWFHVGGGDIPGADSLYYRVTDSDVGKTLGVRVTYTDGGGKHESVTAMLSAEALPAADNVATALALEQGATTSVADNADVTGGIRIGNIEITDADGGAYGTLELAGDDANLFELRGTVLWLKAGASLDHETAARLDVRVQLAENNAIGVDIPLTVAEAAAVLPVIRGWGHIIGTADAEMIYGRHTNDMIKGKAGNDIIDAGEGVDTYWSTQSQSGRPTSEYAVHINLQDGTRWKQNAEGKWVSGTTSDYTHIRVWYDLDNDGVAEESDEFDYIVNFEKLHVRAGKGGNNHIIGGDGDDWVISSLRNNNVYDGGEGNDWLEINSSYALNFDVDDATRWQQNDAGEWESGTTADYTYQRVWADVNGNGIADESDYYTYFRNFENYYFFSNYTDDDDNLAGSDGNDTFYTAGGNDVLKGRGGNDVMYASVGDDTLDGGSGQNTLDGGAGDDIFVLYQGPLAEGIANLDVVLDFSWGDHSGYYHYDINSPYYHGLRPHFAGQEAFGGYDRIRVETETGSETTLEALKAAANIRWTQDSNYEYGAEWQGVGDVRYRNDSDLNDTIIYNTRGTADESDDVILMILQDFTEPLTIDHFQVVKREGSEVPQTPVDHNEAPTATDGFLISIREGVAHIFQAVDFEPLFEDVDEGDELTSITITSLPDQGLLTFSGNAVSVGQVIVLDEIDLLAFTSDIAATTRYTAKFNFTVSDGEASSAEATFHIIVDAVDDHATELALSPNFAPTIAEDADVTEGIKLGIIVITDPDGGTHGTLELAGADAKLFELRGVELWLKPGTPLDHEAAALLKVRVQLAENNLIGIDIPVTITDDDQGDAEFEIVSDGDPANPAVGDALYVKSIVDDPDGNGAGGFDYQWFYVGGDDIAGATAARFAIANADVGKAIGVRVTYTDGRGTEESIEVLVNAALTLAKGATTPLKTVDLSGETAPHHVKTGIGETKIKTGAGDDKVDPGQGDDEVDLGAGGKDKVVYRFAVTNGRFVAWDGEDVIKGFTPGEDTLQLSSRDADAVETLEEFVSQLGESFHATLELEYKGSGALENLDNYTVTGINLYFLPAATPFSTSILGGEFLTIEFAEAIDWTAFEEQWLKGLDEDPGYNEWTLFFNPTEGVKKALGDILGLSVEIDHSRSVATGSDEDNTVTIDDDSGDWVVHTKGGDDTVTLSNGTEELIYVLADDGTGITPADGTDIVNNFTLGSDKLSFVDSDGNPAAREDLFGRMTSVELNYDGTHYTGIVFTMGDESLTINFATPLGTDDAGLNAAANSGAAPGSGVVTVALDASYVDDLFDGTDGKGIDVTSTLPTELL
jgi:VCBS repeat-containing protein